MKWELLDGDDQPKLECVAKMEDAVRGLAVDKYSLTAVSYEGGCTVWDFWS